VCLEHLNPWNVGRLSEYTDTQLIDLLSRDDRPAFTELYNRYWGRLFTVAANKLDKDLESAEELVQDIFLDLWRRRKDLGTIARLSGYLAVAVKYKVIDARLKKKRLKVYKARSADSLSIMDRSTEEQLRFNELQRRLTLVVQDLPERSRLIYTLSRDSGYSHKQIGDQLSISHKTVEAHLSRIVKLIRSKLRSMLAGIFF
jgi:RNA polymerase sigma-70 factor (family 1)